MDQLYRTPANRPRQLTDAADEPAYWQADAIAAEFARSPDLAVVAHHR